MLEIDVLWSAKTSHAILTTSSKTLSIPERTQYFAGVTNTVIDVNYGLALL